MLTSVSSFCTVFITLTLNVEQIYKLRKFGWKKKCLTLELLKINAHKQSVVFTISY